MNRAFNSREVAAVLGMAEATFRGRWGCMVADKGFPKPLPHGGPLAWDPAHVYAWIDRELPPQLRASAAAFRAALDAAHGARDPIHQDEDAAWRRKLDERFIGVARSS